MARLVAHPFQFGPWWLWVMVAALAAFFIIELVYIHWAFNTSRRRDLRAFKVECAKNDQRLDDLWAEPAYPVRVLTLVDGSLLGDKEVAS